MTTYYVTRSSTTAWRDEDIAMSTVRTGPFTNEGDAQVALEDAIQNEVDGLKEHNIERALAFAQLLGQVKATGQTDVTAEGIRFQITSW